MLKRTSMALHGPDFYSSTNPIFHPSHTDIGSDLPVYRSFIQVKDFIYSVLSALNTLPPSGNILLILQVGPIIPVLGSIPLLLWLDQITSHCSPSIYFIYFIVPVTLFGWLFDSFLSLPPNHTSHEVCYLSPRAEVYSHSLLNEWITAASFLMLRGCLRLSGLFCSPEMRIKFSTLPGIKWGEG